MNNNQHSPGPYHAAHAGGQWYTLYNADGYRIGAVRGAATANLIAAAPELLEALKHLAHNAKASGANMGLALDVAQEVIRKVEA